MFRINTNFLKKLRSTNSKNKSNDDKSNDDRQNSPIIESINDHMKRWYPELYENTRINHKEQETYNEYIEQRAEEIV